MKVQQVIEGLQKLDPTMEIAVEYFVKSDFDHIFTAENPTADPMNDNEWATVVRRADNLVGGWYEEMEDAVRYIILERNAR